MASLLDRRDRQQPSPAIEDLDPAQTLAALEHGVARRRAAELDDLLLVAHWAALHGTDPRDDPDADHSSRRPPGGDRLEQVGGDGTPPVRELSLCELGIARGVHTLTARAVTADVLDLVHRLPRTWAVVRDLRTDAWVARKVASMSRHLDLSAVAVVDAAVARAIAGEAPSRVFALAEAKVIEADREGHQARLDAARQRRGVFLGRADDDGLQCVIARVTRGDAAWVDATVSRVAEVLATRPEHEGASRDLLRATAFGHLARPAELLRLLLDEDGRSRPDPDPDPDEPDPTPCRALALPADLLDRLTTADLAALRPRATLYVHLHEDALAGRAPGVARVEGLGPHLLGELRELLGGARVRVSGVIDLAEQVSVCAYEHPESIRERIHLLRPGDRFPHASRTSRNLDLDHLAPYDPHGPPGQTGSHTSQPLSRTGHRARTHLPYRVRPLPTGETVWRTPNGRHRVVDANGTHPIASEEAAALTDGDPVDRALARLLHRVSTGQERK